jgi:hypothetical protein
MQDISVFQVKLQNYVIFQVLTTASKGIKAYGVQRRLGGLLQRDYTELYPRMISYSGETSPAS